MYSEELKNLELVAKEKQLGIWSIPNYVTENDSFDNLADSFETVSSDLLKLLEEEMKKVGVDVAKELESIANEQ